MIMVMITIVIMVNSATISNDYNGDNNNVVILRIEEWEKLMVNVINVM